MVCSYGDKHDVAAFQKHRLKEKVVFCYYTEHTDYIFSQHCDIVDAIKLRDEQQAAEAMEAHLAFIKKLLLEKLNSEKQ